MFRAQPSRFASAGLAGTALALSTLLAACGGSSDSGSAATPKDVAITFTAVANGVAAKCGTTIPSVGTSSAAVDLQDLRFYVNQVALVDAAGNAVPVTLATNTWQSNGTTLIALADGTGTACGGTPLATNATVTGTVPAGTYTGLQFEVGVPESVNHTDTTTAAAPLNVAAMGWSWTAGRKFVKIEVNPTANVTKSDGSQATSWFFHLGSTGCTVAAGATPDKATCTNSNRVPVRFATFDAAAQNVALDLSALFAASDVTRDTGGAVGCMSGGTDADCSGIFTKLQVNLTTGAPLAGGSTAQNIFVARSK